MRILIFIDAFEQGGAARLVSIIASGLANRGYEIGIASNWHRPVAYPLDEKIQRIEWYKSDYYQKNKIHVFVDVISQGRRIIKNFHPNVIMSTIPHIVFLSRISGVLLNVPYIFMDQTSFARKEDRFTHFVRHYYFNFADAVTLLTNVDAKILGSRLPKKVVINNPLPYPIYEGSCEQGKTILALGHTDRWDIKGLDILMRVWGMLGKKYPEWKVSIIGGESEKTKGYLLDIAKEAGVDSQVEFLGFRTDADAVMRNSSIYVLTSRTEGFSLSLIEAMSQGLPAVAFKIHGVIEDVTEDGHGTLLVDDGDEKGFADKLESLIVDSDKRNQLAEEGRQFVKKYSPCAILDQWEALIKKVAKQ